MPKDEHPPYIDDADYGRFLDKTVKESMIDYIISNLILLAMLVVFLMCVSVIFTHRNLIPLVTYMLLVAMYKLVWQKF